MAEPLLIPADAAQRLLAAANGDAALLYLYLLQNRPLADAQTALRMTQARYDLSCATLQQLGLWPQEARTHLDASQARSYRACVMRSAVCAPESGRFSKR